ncbi:MAG TPA: serine hydrolase domain-containing protein [Candidatus Saccharimonadales bacterium]
MNIKSRVTSKHSGCLLLLRRPQAVWVFLLALIGALTFGIHEVKAQFVDVVIDAPSNSILQQDTNHIRDIGTVGVLAEYTIEVPGTAATFRARSGTAVRGTTIPVSWNSHVRIGSTTKTMVSTVILQLEAEGKLSINDKVEKWLPGVIAGHGNNGERITIRNLLQHTSGLFDYIEADAMLETLVTPEGFYPNRYNTYTLRQLAALAVAHPPNFAPGARWEYSNTNYIVAGMIIEAVTGQPWGKQLKDRIFIPVGMSHTSEPGNNPSLPVPFPRGYEIFGDDTPYYDTTEHNMTWGSPAGSLISTPRDVNKFFRALMKGRLLPPAQMAELKTTVPMGADYEAIWPGARYGLGIFSTKLPCGGIYWHHGGDVIGYSNTNGVTPDGIKSAMVASSTNTLGDPEFAEGSIRYTNELVWNALCGYDTDQEDTKAQPLHSMGKPHHKPL